MPVSKNPLLPLRRKSSTSSPISSARRKRKSASALDDTSERLDDVGLLPSLAPKNISQDVESLIRYIHAHTWAPIPDRASGMGSERISEVLRFREALPRIVSLSHLHAVSKSSTETERELARLMARGAVRKITVPGRGKGGASIGEGVVLMEDWKTSVREEIGLNEDVKEKYIALLSANPAATTTIPTATLSNDEVRNLVTAGYLTSPTALSSASNASTLFAPLGSTSFLSTSGTKGATGTLAAVGGLGAVHDSGGSGSSLATKDNRTPTTFPKNSRDMTPTLPSTGPYLKLLTSARTHLLLLLKMLSPRFKEATLDLLRERWDGNVLNAGDGGSLAKKARGEWTGVAPGKTKKWREFWGLEFEWVLAECVGGGVVEVFDTGVGVQGVRAT